MRFITKKTGEVAKLKGLCELPATGLLVGGREGILPHLVALSQIQNASKYHGHPHRILVNNTYDPLKVLVV